MNEQWIQEYLKNYPQQPFVEYLKNHPDDSNNLIRTNYEDLSWIIEKSKSLSKTQQYAHNKSIITLDEQVLFVLIKLTQNLGDASLAQLFGISESSKDDIYSYWQSIFLSNHLLSHKINLVKRRFCVKKYQNTQTVVGDTFLHGSVDKFEYSTPATIDYHARPVMSSCIQTLSLNQSLPLIQANQLLPHDGLFVRRNNQFGTRMPIGIKKLIEQGIMIEQTNVRFDDFISLNNDQVPYPQDENSLAVSYGIAPINFNQKRDKRATHYLEIALRTSAISPKKYPLNQAPPVNYIFVIDTSGSMDGEKLDTVKSAIQKVFENLKDDDAIGIIAFDDRPKTLLQATSVEKINIDNFSQLLSSMSADRGTDLNVALSFGIDEIIRHKKIHSLNHIYLFTDGNPTSGETDWIKIRQDIEAKTRGNIRLSTFAFGSDANLRELDALAGLTGGESTFVTCPADIQSNLKDELNRREHLAAINVQIKVDIDSDVDIIYFYGHDLITEPAARAAVLQDVENAGKKAQEEFGVKPEADLVTEKNGIRIFVPDLAVGETYWLVFELAIPETKQQTGVGKATVQYLDTFTRQNQKPEWELSFPGSLPSDLVVEHGLALWTSEVAFFAIDDLYEQDINTAKKRIENHATLLYSVNDTLSSSYLTDDVITLRKFLSLSGNLGKIQTVSDMPTRGGQNFYTYTLSKFGRVRNGFNRNSG